MKLSAGSEAAPRLVKAGSVTVKIYTGRIGPYRTFTVYWRAAGRYPETITLPVSDDISLPFTECMNRTLLRLPNFNHPDAGALVDQYAEAFRQAVNAFVR